MNKICIGLRQLISEMRSSNFLLPITVAINNVPQKYIE